MVSDFDNRGPFVERIYDIVVAPDRLEALVDIWTERLPALMPSQGGLHILEADELLPHVKCAESVLKSRDDATNIVPPPAGQAWVSSVRCAAAVVTRGGHVVAANSSAVAQLRLRPGSAFEMIALNEEDRLSLSAEIAIPRKPDNGSARILRFRSTRHEQPVVVRLVENIGGDCNLVGIVTTVVSWPDGLSALVQSTFGLTASEAGVLKKLTLGHSVKDIATATGRSVDTIRSHIGELLSKTETHSQIELIRLMIGLLQVVDEEPQDPPDARVFVSNNGNVYHSLLLPDGRTIDYLTIGDPVGRTFILMPNGIGTTRFPPRDERAMAKRGLRMVVPVRAGYGRSSPVPPGRNVYDIAADDHIALLDHLGLAHAPFVTLCDDFRMAVEIAARKPGRISAIIGCGASLPIVTPAHLSRMTKFSRFAKANARFAPRAMPYVGLAFFALARSLGPKRYLQLVMANSPSDLAALEDAEVMDTIIRGSEIALEPGFTAHVAWSAEAIANFGTDWTGTLRSCRVPLTLFAGEDDPFSPFETAQEYAAQMPHIRLVGLPKTGQIMFAHSGQLFDRVEEAMDQGRQTEAGPTAPAARTCSSIRVLSVPSRG